ncbi:hypothetical protein GSI_02961 [Ganoderma sinense ZZ0214-1]|uniref:Uncharacterized protein n=1 Tax=Ganoderma sinense ZZ0214-1 TaxID=1077348 RepID=A0A2G8SN37_9APHY|nr:hypothetical protein GSI_02961 [Ganoderma sinense ZZ0214-1]
MEDSCDSSRCLNASGRRYLAWFLHSTSLLEALRRERWSGRREKAEEARILKRVEASNEASGKDSEQPMAGRLLASLNRVQTGLIRTAS